MIPKAQIIISDLGCLLFASHLKSISYELGKLNKDIDCKMVIRVDSEKYTIYLMDNKSPLNDK